MDNNKFLASLPDPWSFLSNDNNGVGIDNLCSTIEQSLYTASLEAKCKRQVIVNGNNENRRKWLLDQNDMRKIWLSINWNGTFDNKVSNTPSDFEKVNYFSNLFKKNIDNQGPI